VRSFRFLFRSRRFGDERSRGRAFRGSVSGAMSRDSVSALLSQVLRLRIFQLLPVLHHSSQGSR
jgi:hypothetical protein